MEKLGCKMDDAIKSVTHDKYGVANNSIICFGSEVLFKNGYKTSEYTKVVRDRFDDYNLARKYCIQTNIISLRNRLNEVNDYLRFLNNNELTLINNKEFDEYVRFKTKKNKLEEYSLLDKDFKVIGKRDGIEIESPDAKYIVMSLHEFDTLWKDHIELAKLYNAGVDNWIGYDEAIKDEDLV